MKKSCTGCGKEGKSLSFTYITDPDLYCGKCMPEMWKKYCLRYGKRDGCCESLINDGVCPGHLKYLKDKEEKDEKRKTATLLFPA